MDLWQRIRDWVAGPADAPAPDVAAACREDVLPGLVAAVRSPSPVVARGGTAALRKLGADALPAVPALAELAGSPIPAADAPARVQHEHARAEAAYALGDLLALVSAHRPVRLRRPPDDDAPAPDAVELLLAAADDPEATVRAQAWVGLSRYLDEPRVRHAARAALDDPDANVRRQVVHAVSPRGPA